MTLLSEGMAQKSVNPPFARFEKASFGFEPPITLDKSQSGSPLDEQTPLHFFKSTPVSFYASFPTKKQKEIILPLQTPKDITQQRLSIKVLKTQEERLLISHLRQYTDFKSEQDLDPTLEAIDNLKDSLGIVMAISLNDRIITTIRFVPTGHGVTLTERLWQGVTAEQERFGPNTWEIGRLIMAPEDRHPDLLPRCLALALSELVKLKNVQHLHATATVPLSRLYRRFGFRTEGTLESKKGKKFTLIYGQVSEIAAALKVSLSQTLTENTIFKSCSSLKLFENLRKFDEHIRYVPPNETCVDYTVNSQIKFALS